MEFENQVLTVPSGLQGHIRTLLTPGSGSSRALATLLEELGDALVDVERPPRWLVLQDDDEMELLVHLATPFFVAQGYDADEYFDEREDETLYIDASGEAFLRDNGKEYEVDAPRFEEVHAVVLGNGDVLADFAWFEAVPDGPVFMMIMEDAEAAYRSNLEPYSR